MIDKTVVATFLESSPNPTWLADSDGRCVYANQALREISAISVDGLGDLGWLELVADEDKNVSSALWQEARVHNQPYRTRFVLGGKNSARGSSVDVVGAGHVAPDGAEVWLFTAVASSSSNTKLQPIEANLQATLSALPIQAWYARSSGVLAFANQATAEYLGLPSDHPLRFAARFEVPLDAYLAFLHPDDRAHLIKHWDEAMQSGHAREVQFRLLGASGEYRWFLTRAEPLRDENGQVDYWVGANIDIDEKKQASEALDIARERIGSARQAAAIAEFSASLSHKIVQPLAAVVANARAALNWLSSESPSLLQAIGALECVVRDGMSLGNIVHEMRQYFDHRRPTPRAIDLHALLNQVIDLQAPDLRDKQIAINRELNPDLPLAFADRSQIQQVLFNLMGDACEVISRSEGPKELTIRTSVFKGNVCLEVQNSGGYLADLEDSLEVVVADESLRAVGAMGISYSIIEAQGGKLETLRLKRGGTRIRIQLPPFTSP